ncbi:MAG: hypothetical protein M5U14_02180 [Acidimicrobiia bacterium]|nr:hypothetical protein [Acidimicrobiia bacterium]
MRVRVVDGRPVAQDANRLGQYERDAGQAEREQPRATVERGEVEHIPEGGNAEGEGFTDRCESIN